jgi:protein-disulfide isomerase
MHDRIFEEQAEWAAERDATAIFRRYATEVGLDASRYDGCMGAAKYAGRIQASHQEGMRLGVNSTPTLLVAGRLYQGRFDSDAIVRLADSLAAARPAQ